MGIKTVDYQQNLAIANAVNNALAVLQQRGLPLPDHIKIDVDQFVKWAQQFGLLPHDLPTAFTFIDTPTAKAVGFLMTPRDPECR